MEGIDNVAVRMDPDRPAPLKKMCRWTWSFWNEHFCFLKRAVPVKNTKALAAERKV